MQKKLRKVHNLAVPPGLVHDMKRRRGATGAFTSLVSLTARLELTTLTKIIKLHSQLHSQAPEIINM